MPDQAAGLRSRFARRRPSLLIVAGSDARKAAVALHFAREAAAGQRATVLVDGTPGQLAIACESACRYELVHVLAGDVALGDVLRVLTPHLLLLPAARALSRFGSFSADEEARLTDAFSTGIAQALTAAGAGETQVDLIVVNAGAAEAARAVDAFGRDGRVVIVASDQASSLRGAYAEMKSLARQQNIENFEIVVPRRDDEAATGIAFANLANAARRFLDVDVTDGGTVLLPPPKPVAAFPGSRASLDSERFAPDRYPAREPAPFAAFPSMSIFNDEVSHAAAVA